MKKRTIRNRLTVALVIGVVTGIAVLASMGLGVFVLWLMTNTSVFLWIPVVAGLAMAFIYFVDSDEYV